MPTLARIFIHPIKSTRSLPLTQVQVDPMGLEHDRRWMLVHPDGSFLKGRETPSLVRVRAVPTSEGLHLSAPNQPDLLVRTPIPGAPRMEVTIWKDGCTGARAGEAADRWFSQYLGEPVALVYVDSWTERPVDPKYARKEDQVGFADAFPLLLLSTASLEELNRRLPRAVTLEHFRPNLVVEGCEPFAEDGWKRLRVGKAVLEAVTPCARCTFTTVDPVTGVKDADGEPLRTLSDFRRQDGKVMFGQYVLVRRPGLIHVGDLIEPLGG